MQDIIKSAITEILDIRSLDNTKEVRTVGKTTPEHGVKKELFIFKTKKYKYIIEVEDYGDDVLTIAYKPKVGRDFGGKQGKNIYSFQTNDPERYKVLNTVFKKMVEICHANPKTSIIFFGSPDTENIDDSNERFNNSKRFRIYLTACKRLFTPESYTILNDESKSAVAVIPKSNITPDLINKVKLVLNQHL